MRINDFDIYVKKLCFYAMILNNNNKKNKNNISNKK